MSRINLLIAAAIALGLWIAILFVGGAFGHEFWINKYSDPAGGGPCCGWADCEIVPGDLVSIQPDGVYLKHTGESIPQSRIMPSEDGETWRCKFLSGVRENQTRCLFRPGPGM